MPLDTHPRLQGTAAKALDDSHALPNDVLRVLTDEIIDKLPEPAQRAVQKRVGR